MNTMLSLVLASILTVSLIANSKLPSTEIRVAVIKVISAGTPNDLRVVLTKHKLHVNSVILGGGDTVFHEAVVNGSSEIVEDLIEQGADVNVEDKNRHTPLDKAMNAGRVEIVAILKQAGANYSEIFLNPNNVLAMAMLLKRSAVEAKDKGDFGMTDLIRAVMYGDKEMVDLLLDGGANIHTQDEFGRDPLINAVINGDKKMVDLLLDNGANIHTQDKLGRDPLINAVINGDKKMVDLLLKRGANIRTIDNDGKTAQAHANRMLMNSETQKIYLHKRSKYIEIVDLLREHAEH